MLIERWQTLTKAAAANLAPGASEAEGSSNLNRSGAALLTAMQPLCFRGADVVNFLQGYLTIDLEQLTDGIPRFTALTNLKGRVVATGWCQLHGDDRLDWLIHAGLVEAVSQFMARYLAFSKTELIEPEVGSITVGIVDDQGAPSARLIRNDAELDELLADHQPLAASNWYTACIKQGAVIVGPETTENFLPQMIGLVESGAVDFDKGCYLGQEVVARAQHRGEVKRRLTRLAGISQAIDPGTPLTDSAGKERGSLLMSEPPLCLAVVRQPSEEAYQAAGTQLITTPA